MQAIALDKISEYHILCRNVLGL